MEVTRCMFITQLTLLDELQNTTATFSLTLRQLYKMQFYLKLMECLLSMTTNDIYSQ